MGGLTPKGEQLRAAVQAVQSNGTQPADDAPVLADDATDVERALMEANTRLELPKAVHIVAVTQRNADSKTQYDLLLRSGKVVTIDNAATLMHPQRFEAAFAPPSGHVITAERTRPLQKQIAQCLITAATVDYTAGDENEETREWVAAFVRQCLHDDVVDLSDQRARFDVFTQGGGTHSEPAPCFKATDGRLYIVRPALHNYVVTAQGQRHLSSRELGLRMARIDFERPTNREGKITAKRDGQQRTLSLWCSPVGFEVER